MKHIEISPHRPHIRGLHVVEAEIEDWAGALRQSYLNRPDVSADRDWNILIVCGAKAWIVASKKAFLKSVYKNKKCNTFVILGSALILIF